MTLYRNLEGELEAIASEELAGPLERWGWESWTVEDLAKLADYLKSELAPCGMLSVEKAAEAGHSLGTERKEARRFLKRAERQLAIEGHHQHRVERWVMGEHPVAARCRCNAALLCTDAAEKEGEKWVSPERAEELKSKVGIGGAL